MPPEPLQLPVVTPPPIFHEDCEVLWAMLHEPLSLIDGHCTKCGERGDDDRVHLLLRVYPIKGDPKMEETARALELLLHLRRRDLAGKVRRGMSVAELLGATAGPEGHGPRDTTSA